MKLEKLREIASKRTQGSWKYWPKEDNELALGMSIQSEYSYGPAPSLLISTEADVDGIENGAVNLNKEDAQVIVAMANHLDALLDVVELAEENLPYLLTSNLIRGRKLREALEKLEDVE